MKNLNAILLAGTLTLSAPAFATKLDLSVRVDGRDTYQLNGNFMEGNTSRVTGDIKIAITDNGQTININQQIPETTTVNQTNMTIASSDTIIIQDQDKISEVEAKIKRSLFTHKLKSFLIKGDDLLKTLQSTYEEMGESIVTRLNLSTDELNLQMYVDVDDMECINNDQKIICNGGATISIQATDEV